MVNPALLLDCGNTRIKYQHPLEKGVIQSDAELGDLLFRVKATDVLVADVAGRYNSVADICQNKNVNCRQCLVEDSFLGLLLAYKNVSALGVDRWLAMIGARALFNQGTTIVIDAGTAVKIDIIDTNGQHLGGSISTGLKLGSQALHKATNRLPEVTFDFDSKLGTDTKSCISYGIIMSVVALIERAMLQFPDSNVVLTGGDADILHAYLPDTVKVHQDLVLAGMNIYFKQKNS